MLLTITYTGSETSELGYLLYKNPHRPQVFSLNHGKAYVFYPELTDARTTVALLLDIDPIDLARGKGDLGGGVFDYVNDRPYVSSSFMSVAISKVFGTAMTGRADTRQVLADAALDLSATVTMLPCRGEQAKLNQVFEPLGYTVAYEAFAADEMFPQWGERRYVNLTISGKVRLRDLLRHLYVLIPVFDRQKHYWVSRDEVEKLLRMGDTWLPQHPEKNFIIGKYLHRQRTLVNLALGQLAVNEESEEAPGENETREKPPNLNAQRMDAVFAAVKDSGAKRVIDLGCGEGRLLQWLVKDRQFTHIAGMDVSHVALKRTNERLKMEVASEAQRERIKLFQGSLTYKDARISGYDAACVIEVIEHMDESRLATFERVLFEFAKPKTIVLTTPNREYNVNYTGLAHDEMRHGDHRFEWTRVVFEAWAARTAEKFGYTVTYSGIGAVDEQYGASTQMAVFTLKEV